MTFEKPKNKNYCAIVAQLEKFVPLAGCDNVKAAVVFGNYVIVGKDTQAGEVGVFFPIETALAEEFCRENNLFRDPKLNKDTEKKGYFEAHGRVKAVKFRGHKSEGFWLPLAALGYLGITEVPVGTEFDRVGEKEICRKYVPKTNIGRGGLRSAPRMRKVQERLIAGQFRFHEDTDNLRRNIHKIKPESWVSITDKWHGTSVVVANVLVQRELKWWERWLNNLLPGTVGETEYKVVWSSRKVVKGIGEKLEGTPSYYSSDLWGQVKGEIAALLPKGYTVYGEIVGFTQEGGAVQKGYHYGCQPGKHRLMVYRVTVTGVDGRVVELSWPQMKEFCEKRGLEVVKGIYYGQAQDYWSDWFVVTEDILDEWQKGFLAALEKNCVGDWMCVHNNKEVPAEGIVLRVEHLEEFEAYKLKNFKFLEWETKQLDKGEVDLETSEGEGVE